MTSRPTTDLDALSQQIHELDTVVLNGLLEEAETKIDRYYDALDTIDLGASLDLPAFRAALKVRAALQDEIAERANAKADRHGIAH